jgi:integrase
MWQHHFQARCGSTLLRDVRCADVQSWLEAIAREDRTKTGEALRHESMKHLKSFASGIFSHARRQGFYDGANPVENTAIPPSPQGQDTYAYSLEEITRMLMVLPEPAATLVTVAAYTGARRGEIRGMRWENYHDNAIYIEHSIWESHVSEPKTKASKAPVPIIRQLAARLELHRKRLGLPISGVMFPAANGQPLSLNNVLNRQIRPALKKAGIEWHGWHGFRRGLATNLNRMGVQDKTIQAMLRHSNISTTTNIYIKSVDADVVSAMNALEAELCAERAPGAAVFPPSVVN